MLAHTFANGARLICAHCYDLYFELIELRPKLFPSLKLSDAVGSPVTSEELEQNCFAFQRVATKGIAQMVGGVERQQLGRFPTGC